MMRQFSTKLAPRGAFCLGIAVSFTLAGVFIADGALITLGVSAITLMLCCFVLDNAPLLFCFGGHSFVDLLWRARVDFVWLGGSSFPWSNGHRAIRCI